MAEAVDSVEEEFVLSSDGVEVFDAVAVELAVVDELLEAFSFAVDFESESVDCSNAEMPLAAGAFDAVVWTTSSTR